MGVLTAPTDNARRTPADISFRMNARGTRATRQRKGVEMQRYVCGICGYVYDPAEGDPDGGIEPGVAFEDLPDDWVCPVCGADKSEFSPE